MLQDFKCVGPFYDIAKERVKVIIATSKDVAHAWAFPLNFFRNNLNSFNKEHVDTCTSSGLIFAQI